MSCNLVGKAKIYKRLYVVNYVITKITVINSRVICEKEQISTTAILYDSN